MKKIGETRQAQRQLTLFFVMASASIASASGGNSKIDETQEEHQK